MASWQIYMLLDPNWIRHVRFSHIWKTAIQKSVTGVEKRAGLFTWARLKIKVTFELMDHAMANWLIRKIWKHQHHVWGIPIWQDETSLTAQALAGQPILTVGSTDNKHFEVGDEVMLQDLDDFTSYEIGEVFDVLPTQITLDDNLTGTWPVGTLVFPVFPARLSNTEEIRQYTDRMGTYTLKAEETYE